MIRVGGVRIDASMETATLEKNIADINRRLDTFTSGAKQAFAGLGVGLSIRGLESFVQQMGRLAFQLRALPRPGDGGGHGAALMGDGSPVGPFELWNC